MRPRRSGRCFAGLALAVSCSPPPSPLPAPAAPKASATAAQSAAVAPPTLRWKPDPFASVPVVIAPKRLLLREENGVVCVDIDGHEIWRRRFTHQVTSVVSRGDTVFVGDFDAKLHRLKLSDGSDRAPLSLPEIARGGMALEGGRVALFAHDSVMFVDDGEVTEATRDMHTHAMDAVRDDKGRFWLATDDEWALLDDEGKLLVGYQREGEGSAASYPPSFHDGFAWFFQGGDRGGALLKVDVEACLPTLKEKRPFRGFPPTCVVDQVARPEIYRSPHQTGTGDIVVLSHASYAKSDGSLVDRHLEAFRDVSPLWRVRLGRLGMPAEVSMCGGALVVNDRRRILRFDLQNGTKHDSLGYGRWVFCANDELIIVGVDTISRHPPPQRNALR